MRDKPITCPADLQARLDKHPDHTHFTLTRSEITALLSCLPHQPHEPRVDVDRLAEAIAARLKVPHANPP